MASAERIHDVAANGSACPQEAQIFSVSAREHLLPSDAERIMTAAKAAQLHDFILTMKVSTRPSSASAAPTLEAQRQRLKLAGPCRPGSAISTAPVPSMPGGTTHPETSPDLVGKTAVIVSQRVSWPNAATASARSRWCRQRYGSHAGLVKAGGFYARLHAQQTE